MNIELLLNQDGDEAIASLNEMVNEKCDYGDNIRCLSGAERTFYFAQTFEQEVNDGGFGQFFYNTGGDYTEETYQSLKRLGAEKTAALLKSAMDLFPDGVVPKDEEERQGILETLEEKDGGIWEKFDNRFYDYEEDLSALNLDFIRAHLKEFRE